MTNNDSAESGRGTSQRQIRLEVKKTPRGKLLTFADDTAPSGFRGMTDAEVKAHDYIEKIVSRFDTEAVEPGRVGTVVVPESGDPSVEWCSDEAAAAAEGGR